MAPLRDGPTSLLGFVDVQVNGYKGVSFSDASLDREACARACTQILAEGGLAACVPTVITSPLETYAKVLPILADVIEDGASPCAGRLLGYGVVLVIAGGYNMHAVCVSLVNP